MELEGLKRSLELLKERGVTLDCIVTDRHLQIQKFLRESSITQFFDVWHIEKGIFLYINFYVNKSIVNTIIILFRHKPGFLQSHQ